MEKTVYKYGYRLRPPSIGTQPMNGIMEMVNEKLAKGEKYWGYVTYDRKLTDKEMFEYDLELLEGE